MNMNEVARTKSDKNNFQTLGLSIENQGQIQSQQRAMDEPVVRFQSEVSKYLPGGKIVSFEEQLLIDQHRQQLLNEKRFQMIQNVEQASSNFKKKSTGSNLRFPSGVQMTGYHARKTSQQTTKTVSANSLHSFAPNRSNYFVESVASASYGVGVEWNRNINNSRHKLIRKPDFSLGYSPSGNILPRTKIATKVAQHHFLGDINRPVADDKGSMLETRAQSTFLHHTHNTSIQTQQNSNTKTLNYTSDLSLVNKAEQRKAMHHLLEKVRTYNQTEQNIGSHPETSRGIQPSRGKSFESIEVPRVLQKIVLPSLQSGAVSKGNIQAINHNRYHSSMGVMSSILKDTGLDLSKQKQGAFGLKNTIETSTIFQAYTEKPCEPEHSISQVSFDVSDSENAEIELKRVKVQEVKKDPRKEMLSTSLYKTSNLVGRNEPSNQEPINNYFIKPTPGPGFKKFQVLSSLMVRNLEKTFEKAGHGANRRMQMRLKNEFDKTFKVKTKKISVSLKPVKYRNVNNSMGQIDSDEKDEKSKDSRKKTSQISYQTTSSNLSLSKKKSVDSVDSSDDEIFKQTKADVQSEIKIRRSKKPIRELKSHPILPKGMTKKTLFDDHLFNKWLKECFRPKLPQTEDLVQKQLARNQKKDRRRLQRLEEKKIKGSSDESQGFSSSQNGSESSSSSEKKSQKVIKAEEEKTLAEQLEEQLQNQEQMRINSILKKENVDSDPELKDKEKVKQLVEQIKTVEEDFTLKLSMEVSQILSYFNVTIEGTHDKRRHKRDRLVKHFLRQFQKLLQLEKEWAFDQNNLTNQLDESERKKFCLMKLDRKEQDLMADIQLLGEKGMETLHKRLEYKVLYKLLDQEEEEAEQRLLEAKGKALRELLQKKPPSKHMLDFQNRLQPDKTLEEIKLEPNQNESMSPQRKFVTSSYGSALISELRHSKLDKDRVKHSLDRRMGFDAGDLQLDTMGYIRAAQIVKKLQSTLALLSSQFVTAEPSQYKKLEEKIPKITEKPSTISAVLEKKQKEIQRKQNLEKCDNIEVFEKSRLQQQYFESLKVRQLNENDRDVQINSLYSQYCIQKGNVQDLPVFTRIKQNILALSGYSLNSGVCKALGVFLAESNWRIDKSYILQELVLDNNDISDNDFAQILAGLSVQGQLQKLSYIRNDFGLHSVAQIERLIQVQIANNRENQNHVQLSQIRLIKVKTNPEVLTQLFANCLPIMPNLQQLKLSGIFLGNNEIVQELMNGLRTHSQQLELLDLQDTQLTVGQLQIVTGELKSFKSLLSLNLSFNIVRDVSELLVQNLCELITMDSKLNHLSLSYMAFSFKVCSQITEAASRSLGLCSLHLSGNQLSLVQQQFLMRILGILENQLETQTSPNKINTKEIKAVLKKEMNPLEKSSSLNSSERRSKMINDQINGQSNIVKTNAPISTATEPIQQMQASTENLGNPKQKSYSVQKIVNSYASKDNMTHIAKMHSLQDAQSGFRLGSHNNLVFTRQVFNPELMFNQDTNKEGIQHDYLGPFSWHVQQKTDGCYICEQWRYCILYFSRKQVIQGDFFSEVTGEAVRVGLDKVCGFKATSEEDQNDQPWLIGTFTAVSRSRLAYTADFQSLLRQRLKKSRLLQIKQKAIGQALLSQPITKIMPYSGSETRPGSSRKVSTEAEVLEREVEVATKKYSRKLSVQPLDLASHNKRITQIISSLNNFDDGQSSDFSVDDDSNLLELMQKLKKVDPEALILNFSQSDDPELESTDDSILIDDVDDAKQTSDIIIRNKRHDFFAFAAYVPPGKHLLILRDVGTRQFKKYDQSRVNQSNYGGGFINSQRRNSGSGGLPKSSLLRLASYKENKSDYYYKELLVEPRQSCIMKTYSDPFSYSQISKKQPKKDDLS